jgi:hypothetical protein
LLSDPEDGVWSTSNSPGQFSDLLCAPVKLREDMLVVGFDVPNYWFPFVPARDGRLDDITVLFESPIGECTGSRDVRRIALRVVIGLLQLKDETMQLKD